MEPLTRLIAKRELAWITTRLGSPFHFYGFVYVRKNPKFRKTCKDHEKYSYFQHHLSIWLSETYTIGRLIGS